MNDDAAVSASLSLQRGPDVRVGADRIALLDAVAAHGSISAAGRALGVSYRTAWDGVRALNNLFDQPLVVAQTGGAHGGAAQVTPRGEAVLAAYRRVERELLVLLGGFEKGLSASDVLWSLGMKTSARNALRGVVTEVTEGAVSSEVSLKVAEGVEITATLTRQSVDDLGLTVGKPAVALIKASFVILATVEPGKTLRTSARNHIDGRIANRDDGAVNSEIILDIAEGKTLVATITRESAIDLDLKVGDPVVALIKAPHVILAVE